MFIKSATAWPLLTAVVLLLPVVFCKDLRVRGNKECNAIANQMQLKGFTYPWWNATLEDDTAGSVGANSCPTVAGSGSATKNEKCCKSFDVMVVRNDTHQAFSEKWLGPKLNLQAKVFNDSKTKFDLTFKALLSRAHASFHAMFEKTYGLLYIKHAQVFHELFNTFNAYYDAGRGSLEEKLNKFFAILTRKMFEVLNSQYEFDDAYLSCATIVIGEKQGSDLHRQIVSSLRRSFVATKALSQGLHDGFQVLNNVVELEPSPDCVQSLAAMLRCPICMEQRAYKPCIPLCNKVSKGCLGGTVGLGRPWNDFVSALEGIIDRLLGPYNVEAVVEPIHIKISEAIMNFQESGPDMSQAVFGKCGKPHLKSRSHEKREARTSDHYDDDEGPKVAEAKARPSNSNQGRNKGSRGSNRQEGDPEKSNDDMQPSKSLERFLRETKKKIQKTKTVWEKLPQQFCNSITKDFSSQLCWNGTSLMKPDKNKTEEDATEKPPTNTGSQNTRASSKLIGDQISALQLITSKLRDAFNGLDVKWVEEKPSFDDLELGSGSGSGEGPSDLDDSDDDDPSGVIKPSRRPPIYSPPPNFNNPPPSIFNFDPKTDDVDTSDDIDDNDDVHQIQFGRDRIPVFIPGVGKETLPGSSGPDGNEGKYVPTVVQKPDAPPPAKNPYPDNDDVTKKVPSSSGNYDVTSRTVAVFKVFTPIFVSMLGKLASLN